MRRWVLCVVLAIAGCGERVVEEQSAAPLSCGAAPSGLLQRPPKDEASLPTTDGLDFLAGFHGQIAAAEKMVERDPSSPTKQLMLASLLGTRGKLFGDLDEVQRAIDILGRAIERAPDEADLYVERAALQQTLHRFAAARRDLEIARKLGASPSTLVTIEQELDWNDGHYDRAIAAIRNPPRRTMMTVLRQARLAHDLGDHATADRLYAEAEDLVDDTHPVPVAFLNFQRGYHAFEVGRLDEAIVFYREAVRRLPGWITAEEHLAEVLLLQGETKEAIALYESVVARSKDPELAAALSDAYRAVGRTSDADAMLARARAGFDAYEKRFPEAAYGHASEFFLASGADPARALAMREANAKVRPNAASFAALAEARLAVSDLSAAKNAIERALAAPVRSATIAWTAARVYAALGDRSRAERHALEACALNPRASVDEPAIP